MAEFYFTETVGTFSLFYTPECDSTNSLAISATGLSSPGQNAAIYTFRQTAGRGQGQNSWDSEPGKNVALSLIIDVTGHQSNLIVYNKAISLAVTDTLSELTGSRCLIKWPNDIFTENGKICGLLIETTRDKGKVWLIAGIGINVNQSRWAGDYPATSLFVEAGQEYVLIEVIREVIRYIDLRLRSIDNNKISLIHKEFNNRLWGKGEVLDFQTPDGSVVSGVLLETDENGRVVIEDKNQKIIALHHGQVKLLKNNSTFFKG